MRTQPMAVVPEKPRISVVVTNDHGPDPDGPSAILWDLI